ncbi:MAG: hypothetical protein IT287_09105 [Bdellovibrionaceae bacterium]|nr:hypothetical protein [Pseudobdellovibrionaceae bacterium]
MTKILATVFMMMIAASAQANQEIFSACEEVSNMAVLAKDNVPFWTADRNSNVKPCYSDIKSFIAQASMEDVAQFNAEYNGQITIYANDSEFAEHITNSKSENLTFAIPAPINKSLTPVIKPNAPGFFSR